MIPAPCTLALSTSSKVSRVNGPVAAELNGEIAILNPESGLYFSLNEVGSLIWKSISDRCSIAEITEVILEAYDVEPRQAEADTLRLINELNRAGLVQIDASAG